MTTPSFGGQMQTKSMKNLSHIGIGTYGIGGRGHRDMPLTEQQDDQVYIDALRYMLTHGINFMELSMGYGHGHAARIVGQVLRGSEMNREDIFITHSLYPRDLENLALIDQDVADFYETLDTDYADSTLVTQSLILKFGRDVVYRKLHELLDSGKSRYVSLSNASPNWIRDFKETFGDKFIAHEGHLSFEVRSLQDNDVFAVCDELSVKNIVWRPLGRGGSVQRNWPLLEELSSRYDKTQSQIILNWIVHCGYAPMIFSTNKNHIDENIEALNFEMSAEDYSRMDIFRPEGYALPEIHWETEQIDDDIVAQVNGFDGYRANSKDTK